MLPRTSTISSKLILCHKGAEIFSSYFLVRVITTFWKILFALAWFLNKFTTWITIPRRLRIEAFHMAFERVRLNRSLAQWTYLALGYFSLVWTPYPSYLLLPLYPCPTSFDIFTSRRCSTFVKFSEYWLSLGTNPIKSSQSTGVQRSFVSSF